MKKILLLVVVLLLTQSFVLADEIIDSKGNITPCKIITIEDGLIEYQKDGCMLSFERVNKDPVFADYVDVRKIISKKVSVERISGYLSVKNFAEVVIKTSDGVMNIPWYWVKNVGVYRPN